MAERFFVDTLITSPNVTLTGAEAHHLARVIRAKVGDEFVLFDGSGAEFPAQVSRIERSNVELVLSHRKDVDRELPFRLVLAVALPKSDRQRWLVEKAVELGVSELVPLTTARSVVQPREATRARLQRTVVEASKQCGRNRLMQLARPVPVQEHLRTAGPEAVRWIAHLGAAGSYGAAADASSVLAEAALVHVAVGPEGGFTEQEVSAALAHDWRTVDLGPRVLRVDTAAVALVSMIVLQRKQ